MGPNRATDVDGCYFVESQFVVAVMRVEYYDYQWYCNGEKSQR